MQKQDKISGTRLSAGEYLQRKKEKIEKFAQYLQICLKLQFSKYFLQKWREKLYISKFRRLHDPA